MERRPSRLWQNLTQPANAEQDTANIPLPPPALLEHLMDKFAPSTPDRTQGLDGAVETAITVAEQRGREEVIRYLLTLSNNS